MYEQKIYFHNILNDHHLIHSDFPISPCWNQLEEMGRDFEAASEKSKSFEYFDENIGLYVHKPFGFQNDMRGN